MAPDGRRAVAVLGRRRAAGPAPLTTSYAGSGIMGAVPDLVTSPLSDAEKAERLEQLSELIEMVRPIIQQDGGDLVLLSADVESGVVELQLQGACSSCAVSSTTLQAGVDRILKDRLEWVTEVIGGVDEDFDFEESSAMGRGAYVPKI